MKKGFTLIELLAVIVILAIILLIAMPIVLNVIDEARKGAFNSTGFGLAKAAESEYMRRSLEGGSTPDIWYVFDTSVQTAYTYNTTTSLYEVSTNELEYTGQGPVEGVIKVHSTGEVEMWIHNGTYCAFLAKDATEVTTDSSDAAACALKVPAVETAFPTV